MLRPAEVVRRVNERLCGDRTGQFVTLLYAVLDLATCTLTYANAGHPRPVLLPAGAAPVPLLESGLVAGVAADAAYRAATVPLRPGDRLWVYSDGLPEAMAPDGQAFGDGRLTAAFRAASRVPPAEPATGVLAAVEAWAGAGGLRDDVSVVAVAPAGGGDGG